MATDRTDKAVLDRSFVAAWSVCLVFYFLQYAMRSAPGVMLPELRTAFGLTALGVTTLVSIYYYTYAVIAVAAGGSVDRWGAKLPIALGIVAVAVGSIVFPFSEVGLIGSGLGRLLQGAGAAFAFTGAVYLAARGFSAKWLATVIGLTQAAGLLGGFAGQFAVGPLVRDVISWQWLWVYLGIALAILAILFFVTTPASHPPVTGSVWHMFAPYKVILRNPQSYLCGIIAGLLFTPTTVGDMIWGVRFLQEGLGIDKAEAIVRSSMVPLGWVIGAPLLGYVADRIGLRKPVLFGGMAVMLLAGLAVIYFTPLLPHYIGGLVFGIASGCAMIPYSMIKEANPDEVKASTAGTMNLIVFGFSAILGPVFGLALQRLSGGGALTSRTFELADSIWVGSIVLALILAFFLRETGTAARPVLPAAGQVRPAE